MKARFSNAGPWKPLLAGALVVVAFALAACGGGGDTTTVTDSTVTTQESEAAAAGTTTTADGQVITTATTTGTSDAATAIPNDQSAVAGATPEVATAPNGTATTSSTSSQAGGVNGVIGEGPAPTTTTAAQTVTTTNPDTGEVTTTTVPATSSAVGTPTTITTTDPNTGQVVTTQTTVPATTGLTTTTPPSNRNTGLTIGGDAILTRPFSADSPWNTSVENRPTDPKSDRWMRLSQLRVANADLVRNNNCNATRRVSPEARRLARTTGIGNPRATRRSANCRVIRTGLTTNTTRWTLPVFSNTQEGATRRVAVCRQFECGPDAVSSVVIPPDACPQPQYDGWMTVVDNTTHTALDFWRARCEADGSLSYHYVKRWDLDGPGFQQPGLPSARGSGLPLFAGLITTDDIAAGRIDHALAISVPGAATRRYVQPASRTDGTGLTDSLPEGARIRLKKKVADQLLKESRHNHGSKNGRHGNGRRHGNRGRADNAGFNRRNPNILHLSSTFVRNDAEQRTARTIIEALRRYGAIVVDRSAAPTLYAQKNADWAGVLPSNLLQDINLKQFEAVKGGQVFYDPPRGQTSFDPNAAIVGSIPATGSGSQGTSAAVAP